MPLTKKNASPVSLTSHRPPSLAEKQIQRQIIDWLLLNNFYIWRQNSVGVFDPSSGKFRRNNGKGHKRGVSDILGVLNDGRLLAIEVKTHKGQLTQEQKLFLGEVNIRGGVAFAARSLEEVKAVLDKVTMKKVPI